MKKIAILGSTGSIGRQALEVIEKLQDKFIVTALATNSNLELLINQVKNFNPQILSIKSKEKTSQLKEIFKNKTVLNDGLVEIAKNADYDILLVAVTGIFGLIPTLEALKRNKTVALANKETLVMAGDIVNKQLQLSKGKIIPVDSEHSAIFQCLQAGNQVENLIITASGGPFLNKPIEEMNNADKTKTLKHPNWNMGNKITVDSATLMNKGLEVIEAHHLFSQDYSKIKVVIHPESIIHSAIEFVDGSVLAQMGVPSMHIPIQYAVTFPERVKGIKSNSLNLFEVKNLSFYEPDLEKFKALKLAIEAGKSGGVCPAILNAANEIAVYAFLDDRFKLGKIVEITEIVLNKFENISNPDLDTLFEVDEKVRIYTKNLVEKFSDE